MVPWPTQLPSTTPKPGLGGELCDALSTKEEAVTDEQRRLNDLHDKEHIPRQQEHIPEFDSLIDKRVAVLWNNVEDDDSAAGQHKMM